MGSKIVVGSWRGNGREAQDIGWMRVGAGLGTDVGH